MAASSVVARVHSSIGCGSSSPSVGAVCPHCDTPLEGIKAKRIKGVGPGTFRFGKRFAYACPNCNKLLGITHRKGFWMG